MTRTLTNPGRPATGGVTLPEILIAFGIVATAVLALIAAFIAGTKLVSQSQQVANATQLARAELEAIREMGYVAIPDADVTYDGRNPDPSIDGFPPHPYDNPPDGYVLLVTVEQKGYYLKSITVEVQWGDIGSKVVLQTYIHP